MSAFAIRVSPHGPENERFEAMPSPKSSCKHQGRDIFGGLAQDWQQALLSCVQTRIVLMYLSDRKQAGVLLLTALAITPMTAAKAADLYKAPAPAVSYKDAPVYVPPNTWAGFYVGINGGYAWNASGNTVSYNDGGAGFIGGADQSTRSQPSGGFGGGQIGYNFQSGSLVYGLETDFQGGDINSRVAGATANGNPFNERERVDWFGTVRGRIGYAFGSTLFYGTGGFAYGDVRERSFVTNGVDSVAAKNSDTQTGYVVGGGVEYKINPAWSLKAEYQYIDLGSAKMTGIDTTGAAVTTNNLDTNFHTVRLGLNYRIGGSYEPLK
jgi:outer membrane immunogenic protein